MPGHYTASNPLYNGTGFADLAVNAAGMKTGTTNNARNRLIYYYQSKLSLTNSAL